MDKEPTVLEIVARHKDCKHYTIGGIIKQALHEDALDYREIRFGRILNEFANISKWKRGIEIFVNYMPNFPREETKPSVVIRCGRSFLRHSGGPHTGVFWDCYGDDFHTLDLAFWEALKCHAPNSVDITPP